MQAISQQMAFAAYVQFLLSSSRMLIWSELGRNQVPGVPSSRAEKHADRSQGTVAERYLFKTGQDRRPNSIRTRPPFGILRSIRTDLVQTPHGAVRCHASCLCASRSFFLCCTVDRKCRSRTAQPSSPSSSRVSGRRRPCRRLCRFSRDWRTTACEDRDEGRP
jgi:hypothetical protein